jgi:hypothetical protein
MQRIGLLERAGERGDTRDANSARQPIAKRQRNLDL